jgi:hypothetical protein
MWLACDYIHIKLIFCSVHFFICKKSIIIILLIRQYLHNSVTSNYVYLPKPYLILMNTILFLLMIKFDKVFLSIYFMKEIYFNRLKFSL